MSKSKKSKKFTARVSDLPHLVDAILQGSNEVQGEVFMDANTKGRECINALFPQARIKWRESDLVKNSEDYTWPSDWMGFTINLPDVIAATETKLPLEITRGANLDEAQPAALALLLAMGVKRQGGRVATFDEDLRSGLQIFHPSSN
jgi:hypothetical protein